MTESRAVTLTSVKANGGVGGRTMSRPRRPEQKTSSLFAEAYEKFKSRRQTIKLDEAKCYQPLLATSLFQYFREDLGGISAVSFAEDTGIIATAFYSGELKICKTHIVNTIGESHTVLPGWEGNYAVSCVKFHPQQPQLLYAASHAGTVHCADVTTVDSKDKHCCNLVITEEKNEINSFDFGPKGDTLITGGKDAAIRIYDTQTNQIVLEYKKPHWSKTSKSSKSSGNTCDRIFHEKRVYCVRSNPDEPNLIITGGWDKVVKVWDTRLNDGCVLNIEGPYIFGECLDINRGRLLTASCVARDSLQLWDLSSGSLISDLSPSNKRVYLYGEFPYAAQFYRGDTTGDLVLAGGAGLGGLQVISVSQSSIVYLFEDEKPVAAVDSSSNGKVTFGGKSSSLLVANIYMLGDTREPSTDLEEDLEAFDSFNLSSLSHIGTIDSGQFKLERTDTHSDIKSLAKSKKSDINIDVKHSRKIKKEKSVPNTLEDVN